jgi:hypothetical protein
MKLHVEHQKNEANSLSGEKQRLFMESVKALEHWIDGQQYTFLTEVNLGNWAELNQRKMAEEVGEIEFYNFCYTPYSAGVHSMWHHIGRFNLKQCKNPLHQFHKVPRVPSFRADFQFLVLAGKYLQMVFDLFDQETGVKIKEQSALRVLCAEIKGIAEDAKN